MTTFAVVQLSQSADYEIEIHGVSGKLVERANFSGNHWIISNENLSKGIYVVRIVNRQLQQSILLLDVQ